MEPGGGSARRGEGPLDAPGTRGHPPVSALPPQGTASAFHSKANSANAGEQPHSAWLNTATSGLWLCSEMVGNLKKNKNAPDLPPLHKIHVFPKSSAKSGAFQTL